MMFEEIKKKYPKAWEKFLKCYYSEFLVQFPNADLNRMWKIDPTKNLKSQIGHLFTFFDEQGIWILRTIRSTNTERGNFPVYYMYNTSFADESFEIVITKAFEILESK